MLDHQYIFLESFLYANKILQETLKYCDKMYFYFLQSINF